MTETVGGIRRLAVALASDACLNGLLARVSARPPLERMLWNSGEPTFRTGVMPPGMDEPPLLADLVEAARRAVAAENRARPSAPVRLRLAVHEGLVALVDGEFRGPGVATVGVLGRDAGPAQGPPAGLRVVVSCRVFEDLAGLAVPPFPLAAFRPFTAGTVPAFAADWDPAGADATD